MTFGVLLRRGAKAETFRTSCPLRNNGTSIYAFQLQRPHLPPLPLMASQLRVSHLSTPNPSRLTTEIFQRTALPLAGVIGIVIASSTVHAEEHIVWPPTSTAITVYMRD